MCVSFAEPVIEMLLVRVVVSMLRLDSYVIDSEWLLVEDASEVLMRVKLVLSEVYQGFKVEKPQVEVAFDKCGFPVTFTNNELVAGGLDILEVTVTVLLPPDGHVLVGD